MSPSNLKETSLTTGKPKSRNPSIVEEDVKNVKGEKSNVMRVNHHVTNVPD